MAGLDPAQRPPAGPDEEFWRADVLFNWDRDDPPWVPSVLAPGLLLGGTPRTDVVVSPGAVASPWQPSAHRGIADACVTMTPIAGPAGEGVLELRVPLRDRPGEPLDMAVLAEAVDWAVRRHGAGKRVLIRCHAGLNRSGLVAVPVLTWVNPSLSFDEALALARERRHRQVLARQEFAAAARLLARPGS